MKKSYSQFGQDEWVLEVLDGLESGYFIDVGAFHPITINNTYLLEKDYNWKGLSIDAQKIAEWSVERNTPLIQACVDGEAGKKVKFVLKGWDSGIQEHLDNGNTSKKIKKMRTRLLSDILDEYNCPKTIHYLDLDVEGAEYSILETFPFDIYKPIIISVEHNDSKHGKHKKDVREFLKQKGYELLKEFEIEDGFVLKDFNNH